MVQVDAYKSNSDFCATPEYKINREIIHASSQYIVELENIALLTYESGSYIYDW